MLAYKNVYSLQDGRLVKNKENKIEYIDENGKKRVKTNPSYKDFAKVGKYPLKEGVFEAGGQTPPLQEHNATYVVENGYIVPKYKEENNEH